MKKWKVTQGKPTKRWKNSTTNLSDTVGAQLHGMNSAIVKMKEEEDDRYTQINGRLTDTEKKILDMERKYESKSDESKGAQVDRNQGKAVITGFHNETSEPEVIQSLKESLTEIGMTMENVGIECPSKPITHAFVRFKNDAERNKFFRSANMLKKELRGRKLNISRSMDADERFHQERMEYVKYCIHEKHNIPLDSISTNWTLKHISVKGQIVVKTCQNGTLTYIKFHDIEAEVEEQMGKWQSKNSLQRL